MHHAIQGTGVLMHHAIQGTGVSMHHAIQGTGVSMHHAKNSDITIYITSYKALEYT